MILNFWRPYPLLKPKKEGWYSCTTNFNGHGTFVKDLYFDPIEGGKWIDQRRQTVFDGYKVYKPCREPLEYNRVHTDGLCEPEVVAWRKQTKAYGWWRR